MLYTRDIILKELDLIEAKKAECNRRLYVLDNASNIEEGKKEQLRLYIESKVLELMNDEDKLAMMVQNL